MAEKKQKTEALRKKLIAETKEKVREEYALRDHHIIKAVAVLEALDENFNVLAEHCLEWYAMHFPELGRIVKDNEAHLKFILLGERKNYSQKKILEFYDNKELVERILKKAKESMGSEIFPEDLKQVQALAKNALELKKQRKELAAYIEKGMQSIAPNFSALCGAILGAKMLATAGSLKKMALLPSSTIQLLGAEKALFRHIRAGVKPPKYGFLFQHAMIKTLKAGLKGKMARSLAAKLSLAVREDYFGKDFIAKDLQKDLEQRLKEIQKS